MARVKISEYKAKRLLVGDRYAGVQIRSGSGIALPEGEWVVKVDQGVKKRFKQGLIAVKPAPAELKAKIAEWEAKGFSQFIAEPFRDYDLSHEQYFSLERVRGGLRMLHTKEGGVDIEAHPEKVQSYLLGDISIAARESGLPEDFLRSTVDAFSRYQFAFLEINPLVVLDGAPQLLDAAVLVDSSGEFFVRGAWTEDDIIKAKAKHEAESRVEALAATTPASLKLNVINPEGALFFLLSGGGGSIVIADEVQLEGAGDLMGNYGEYSGGPSREETYLYAKEVIGLIRASKAPQKALVIAGGVANFTDVRKTFLGIIDALTEVAEELRASGVRVFVRRGGPHEAAGLALMREFLEKEQLLGAVYGSDAIITKAVEDAIRYVRI
jgi:ATP-citrate lyase beta-subunit